MFTSLPRSYKEASPSESIFKIRTILNNLGLFVYEPSWLNPYDGVFSVRLTTDDEFQFGSNGKGTSREYALASAYGEFIERLQNGLFINMPVGKWQLLYDEFKFYFFPDEKILTREEFEKLPMSIQYDFFGYRDFDLVRNKYFAELKEANIGGCVSLPFFDMGSNKRVYLPYNLLLETTGSNGMCAGNTPYEAIFQGLSEIIERYASSEVFYRKLCPPEVPRNYIEQFVGEYLTISEIERSGTYSVVVKDFSANKKLPVLGVVVLNTKKNLYKIRTGCETSFQVALSRCLTELFQGFGDEEEFDKSLLPIPIDEPKWFTEDTDDLIEVRKNEFAKFIKNSSAAFPSNFLKDKFDYAFDPGVFVAKESYKMEVDGLISLMRQIGSNVYIRDVSFLGFPSYYVYAPGISGLGRKVSFKPLNTSGSTIAGTKELSLIMKYIVNFNDLGIKELSHLASLMENLSDNRVLSEYLALDLKEDSAWNQMTPSFFLSLIFYKLNQYDKSKFYLNAFLKHLGIENDYYRIVNKFLDRRIVGQDNNDILACLLKEGHDPVLVNEVLSDLGDTDQVFKYIAFPSCPDCSVCGLTKQCLIEDKFNKMRTIYTVMSKNNIDDSRIFFV